jgi:prepilin-type N-terminal cleavage/methylation domain-containing protein
MTQRRGFTLAEVIISMTLLAIIGAAAVPFYLRSLRSVANTSGQQDAQQSVAFAADFVNHDLRLAGQGIVPGQPLLVQMHDSAVTFNANLVTRDSSASTTGTYIDNNVADSLSLALPVSKAITLPLTTTTYPLTTYFQTTNVLSDAETISFWVKRDTTAGVPANTYVLWRRVNNAAPQLVARNLVFRAGIDSAPFQYFASDTTNPNALMRVKNRRNPTIPYPLTWNLGTGTDTLLREVVSIRLHLTSEYVNPITQKITYRTIDQSIPLENGGLPSYSACPGPPGPPTAIAQYVATANTSASTDSVVIMWGPSADETGGFGNVRQYMVYRKLDTASSWGTVQFQQSAIGKARDTIYDYPPILTSPRYYIYGVVAENCTPQMSTVLQTTTHIFPNP